MLVWIQPHNGQDISQSGNKEGFCYGCCRGQWQLHPGPAIITIKYWPATMAAHWNIKQLECWIWNFSSCYWTFSIALKHQLSARSFSASSHRRSHLSDKKHLWDWSTSQMPDRNQYKINPTEMAIFLIQTIAELYFARQFLQELPSWSLKHRVTWERGKGRTFPAQPFLPNQLHTRVYLSQALFLHQERSEMIAFCHSQLQWALALPDERSLDYQQQADNKSQCWDCLSTLLLIHTGPANSRFVPVFLNLSLFNEYLKTLLYILKQVSTQWNSNNSAKLDVRLILADMSREELWQDRIQRLTFISHSIGFSFT